MTTLLKVLPTNVKVSEVDEIKAKAILHNAENYIVRYLRHDPTVGLATVPVRTSDGTIVKVKGEDGGVVDMPWVRKRVICSGVPYACLIAFMHQNKLLVGWSKRMEDRHLIETQELHTLFKSVMHNVTEASDGYQPLFDEFAAKLMKFLTYQKPEDIEVAFAKKGGKTAAIIRGLNDTISIAGKSVKSAASGVIPQDIAKNLPWFIKHVEESYGGKAANISPANTAVVSVPAVV